MPIATRRRTHSDQRDGMAVRDARNSESADLHHDHQHRPAGRPAGAPGGTIRSSATPARRPTGPGIDLAERRTSQVSCPAVPDRASTPSWRGCRISNSQRCSDRLYRATAEIPTEIANGNRPADLNCIHKLAFALVQFVEMSARKELVIAEGAEVDDPRYAGEAEAGGCWR